MHFGKAYVLTGPEALSCADVAGHISEVALKEVQYIEMTREDAQRDLLSQVPQWLSDSLLQLFDAHNDGVTSVISPHFQELFARPPTSFLQFCYRYVNVYREEFLNYCKEDL